MAKLLASGGTGFCGANLLIQHLWQACVDRRLGNAGDAICSSTFEVVAHQHCAGQMRTGNVGTGPSAGPRRKLGASQQAQVGNGAGQSWQGSIEQQAFELELRSTTIAHDAHATLKAIVIHNASNTPQLAK